MLRVFENRVLRKVFGPKREEVPGEVRQLYDEQLINPKFYSGDRIKVDEISGEYGTFV
jgi:hypothetical protein